MKLLFPAILILLCLENNAQAPPVIQWQKCFGGSKTENGGISQQTADGGYIISGNSNSDDGDVTGNIPGNRIWVVKTDATGTIQWQKNFGGTATNALTDILQATDGGYMLVATTSSIDGDVVGNHGSLDIWVIKLSAAGTLQWQRCYGGSKAEIAGSIRKTSDGGYIIGGETNSIDGDVMGLHGTTDSLDAWILKIDAAGSLQWQKCFGGIKDESITTIIQTADGGYFFTAAVMSSDGDLTCVNFNQNLWLVKLDNTGNIQWQHCWGGLYGDPALDIEQTADGGFIIAGRTYSPDLPGSYGPGGDAYVIKTDATGIVQWQRLLGGSASDEAQSIQLTPDGGYIVAGSTSSADGNICNNKGTEDCWIVKLSSNGTIQWQKTYGGSNTDKAAGIHPTPDGGYIVTGYTSSNDGDVTGNHGLIDWWMFKLSFPGIPLLPLVSITSSDNIICPGQNVRFIAVATNGGTTPSYQWKINGINAAIDEDTIFINSLNDGDMVSCVLTSNAPCVTTPTAVSNIISITVDQSSTPANFLPLDTAICDFGTIDIKATGSYQTYLWNNNAVTPVITISQPGTYWLEVTTSAGCPGRDSVLVLPKECLKGFYMPTGFTPNGDGKNDVLKPILGGNIKQYKFTVQNRWGQIVFQTSEPGKGWDGTFKGIRQDGNVFIWTCAYQFAGEQPKQEKGTVAVIK